MAIPKVRQEPVTSSATVSNRSWLLAIDTATDQAGVALFDGEQLVEMSWPGGRRQTTSVLPVLEEVLTRADVTIIQVGAIAVTAGPGSFTGLRVGLSLAKGLAITGDRALIGVNTLDAAATPYLEAGVSCLALVPAGRGRLVWSRYPVGSEATPPVNASFEEVLEVMAAHPEAIVVGEMTHDQRTAIAAVHDRIASIPFRRPGALARIGFDRWRAGDVDDPVTLEPLYLHGRPNPR